MKALAWSCWTSAKVNGGAQYFDLGFLSESVQSPLLRKIPISSIKNRIIIPDISFAHLSKSRT